MKLSILTLFIFTLIFSSCSQGGKSTETRFRLVTSAITSGVPIAGGVVLSGTNSLGQAFQMGITNPNVDIAMTLTPGSWTFKVVSWQNEAAKGLMTGTARCGYSTSSIQGANSSVTLSLNTQTCSNGQFSPATLMDPAVPNQFREMVLVSCINLNDIAGSANPANEDCSERLRHGSNLGYKVQFAGANNIDGTALPSLTSSCVANPNVAISSYETFLKIPMGGLPFKIIAYEDSNCLKQSSFYPYYSVGAVAIADAEMEIYVGRTLPTVSNKLVFFLPDNYLGKKFSSFGNPYAANWIGPKEILCGGAHCFPDLTVQAVNGTSYENSRENIWELLGTKDLVDQGDLALNYATDRNVGAYGRIIKAMAGYMGSALYSAGHLSCADIPVTGTLSLNARDGVTRSLHFEKGQIPMPYFLSGAMSTIPAGSQPHRLSFEKRIALFESGVLKEMIEFNCNTATGSTNCVPGETCSLNNQAAWMRSSWNDGKSDDQEIFVDSLSGIIEYYKYDKDPTTAASSASRERRKEMRFIKTGGLLYEVSVMEHDLRPSVPSESAEYSQTVVALGSGFLTVHKYPMPTLSWIMAAQNITFAGCMFPAAGSYCAGVLTKSTYSLGTMTLWAAAGGVSLSLGTYDPNLLFSHAKSSIIRLKTSLPTEMTPMTLTDPRLLPGVSPAYLYDAYRSALFYFEGLNHLNEVVNATNTVSTPGCSQSGTELGQKIIYDPTLTGTAASVNTGPISFATTPGTYFGTAYDGITTFLNDGLGINNYSDANTNTVAGVNLTRVQINNPGCQSLVWGTTVAELKIATTFVQDPLIFKSGDILEITVPMKVTLTDTTVVDNPAMQMNSLATDQGFLWIGNQL